MIFLGLLIMATGYFNYRNLPVDAFPDVSPALVQVFTETGGLAPEEIEKYVKSASDNKSKLHVIVCSDKVEIHERNAHRQRIVCKISEDGKLCTEC